MLSSDAKQCIEKSVLCWLATTDKDLQPNVSPKEVFTYENEDTLLIAHIASPKSISNIHSCPQVCVSFIDIFVQKGYKINGKAEIIDAQHPAFHHKKSLLTQLFSDDFHISAVISIHVQSVSPIMAPSYKLFPDTTEEKQIKSAMRTYGVKSL